MKKFLSLLLVVAMLLTTFTAMLVTVTAAGETATVTQVSADTYTIPSDLTVVSATVDTAQTTANWQKLSFGGVGSAVAYKYYLDETWNGDASNVNFRVTEAVTVVAEFSDQAKINSIFLKRHSSYAQRMVGFTISLSADGTTWTEVTKLSGVTGNNDVLITLPDSMTDTFYSYVKLTHDAPTAQGGTWLGIGDVKLLASEIDATSVTQYAGGTYTVPSDLKVITATVLADKTTSLDVQDWDGFIMDGFKKDSVAGYNHTTAVDITIVAQFTPAKLERILMVRHSSYAQRMKSFTVSLSEDGETWTEVTTLPSNLSANYDVEIKLPTSLSDVTYQYIKISRQAVTGWAGIGGVTLFGTEVMPLNGSTLMDMTHVESSNASLANAWNLSNVTQVDAATTGSKHYTVAKLPSPTVLDKVILDYSAQGNRARGGLIYGSVDGEAWEQIAQIPGDSVNHVAMAVAIHSNKAYSYIKVEQADSLKGYTFSLGRINVFGYAEDADRITATNVPEWNVTADTTGIDLWSDDVNARRSGNDTDSVIESTVAKLPYPTKITTIYMVSGDLGGRNRGILYEGSVDGITWEKIISSGHQNDHVYSNGTKRVSVNSNKAYLYIRATNTLTNGAGKDYHWDVRNLAVYGDLMAPTTYGTQVRMGNGTYAVRFLATLQVANYEKAGFEVTASGEGMTGEKFWDEEIGVVYTAILANGERITAEQLNGDDYIIAVSINNISIAKYGKITFTVRPYVEYNGVRAYGTTGSIVYEDGQIRTPWTIAGNDLSQYRIVYHGADMKTQAQTMQASIAAATGYTLPVVQDTASSAVTCEILMGETNRTESASVATPTYLNYVMKTVGNKLVVKTGGEHSMNKVYTDFVSIATGGSTKPVAMDAGYQLLGNYYSDPYDTSLSSGTDLRVMSVNIMAEWESYGGDQSPVSARKEIFFSMLDYYAPTVVGLQEFSPSFYEVLTNEYRDASKWEILKFKNPILTEENEYVLSTVMYRKDLYTLVDSGMKYYSVYGNNRCRCITWAVLRDASGREFCVFSTHWDGDSATEYAPTQLAETVAFINKMAETYPVIGTGDFNSNEWTETFKSLIEQTGMSDAKYAAAIRLNSISSYHEFGVSSQYSGSPDHIISTAGISVLKFETIEANENLYGSDHAWLFADLKLASPTDDIENQTVTVGGDNGTDATVKW